MRPVRWRQKQFFTQDTSRAIIDHIVSTIDHIRSDHDQITSYHLDPLFRRQNTLCKSRTPSGEFTEKSAEFATTESESAEVKKIIFSEGMLSLRPDFSKTTLLRYRQATLAVVEREKNELCTTHRAACTNSTALCAVYRACRSRPTQPQP